MLFPLPQVREIARSRSRCLLCCSGALRGPVWRTPARLAPVSRRMAHREAGEAAGAFRAGLGVVDDQELAARVTDGQLLAAQFEQADLGMKHPGGTARERPDVVPFPQPPERLAFH